MSGLSFFLIPVVGILAAIAVPALSQAKEKAREVQCRNQVHPIGLSCLHYAQQNQGRLPRALSDLDAVSPGVSTLRCPLARDGSASYELVDSLVPTDPAVTVLARETEPRHQGRRAIVFADGHVEMKTAP
jgi:prepilin-type processing-associated H-X9-DG protein